MCRTDIRGYYGQIRKDILYGQLCARVESPALRSLLYQFLHYSVEEGGEFHTPVKGIPRGSALSPLLAAFHLYDCDRDFEQERRLRYVRYMDDFLIFAPERWHLRRAVRKLNGWLEKAGFEQHPEKTFIGRVAKGFDWMGFWFDEKGATSVAPRALNNGLAKLRQLYDRTRHQPAEVQAERVAKYVSRWCRYFRIHPDYMVICYPVSVCFSRPSITHSSLLYPLLDDNNDR
ncbi:reverse transcriptase domain-containing protein [Salmonella enterica]